MESGPIEARKRRAPDRLRFEERLETASAVVLFHPVDEAFARRVGQCLEVAVQEIGRLLAYPEHPATVFLYRDDREMAQGLRETLGYQDWQVEATLRVGISARIRNTLHLHSRLTGWDDYLLHALADEHSQGVIEEIFGARPAREAAWIEEGLSTNLARAALSGRLPELEQRILHRSLRICCHDLVLRRLPRLAELAAQEAWFRNIAQGGRSWSAQYAYADCAVARLIDSHGLDPLLSCLERSQQSRSWQGALEEVTGRTSASLERRIRAALLAQGASRVYLRGMAKRILRLAPLDSIFSRNRSRSGRRAVGCASEPERRSPPRG